MRKLLTVLAVIASISFAACAEKLPPNTSIEAKTALQGKRLVDTLDASIPAIKALVCVPGAPPTAIKTCISAQTADKIFGGLETAGKTAKELSAVLTAYDNAKTVEEQAPLKSKLTALLQTIKNTLVNIQVSPENEEARNSVVKILETAFNIIIAIGAF